MKKNLRALFIFTPLLLLSACTPDSDRRGDLWEEIDVDLPAHSTASMSNETQRKTEEIVESVLDEGNLSLPPFYQNGELSYYLPSKKLEGSIFDDDNNQAVAQAYVEAGGWDGDRGWNHVSGLLDWYEVGILEKAPYEGWSLVVLNVSCEGPCAQSDFYRFAYNQGSGEVIYLPQHSSSTESTDGWLEAFLEEKDENLALKNLKLPESVEIPNSDETVFLNSTYGRASMNFSEEDLLFEDPELGAFYSNEHSGCLRYLHLDGTVFTYVYQPDIESVITWEEGGQTNLGENYAFDKGSCGAVHACYILNNEVQKDQLKKVGQTDSGFIFYEVKDPVELNEEELYKEGVKSDANMLINRRFRIQNGIREYSEQAPIGFEAFLTQNPMLFWEDPFGRMSLIAHNDFENPAECGKPVIYLYPEQEQKITVAVENIEFTKTIPEHGPNGWTVSAQPNGTLINHSDGQEYPYLFWEGHSTEQTSINSGFTVPRNEVESFLYESLTQLGLNEKEQADFMEFWLPRMLDNKEPYFFIHFTGTHDFNKVAPLNIEPKPDTLIRIFMYYEPTFEQWGLPEQKLSTIPREGFTVIEWGGTAAWPWDPELDE